MPQHGWVTVRSIPEVSYAGYGDRATAYHDALKNFFDEYKVCSHCKGAGYLTKKPTQPVKRECIKIRGIRDLEKAKENEGVSLSDLIREILSFKLENRRPCPKCKGLKFLKRKSK